MALQGQGDEVQAGISAAMALQGPQGRPLHFLAAHLGLQQSWTREGFLEEVQRIIIVQDGNCLGNGLELFCACLRPFLPLGRLRVAALGQVGEELLVLRQRLLGVLQILFEVHNLDTGLSLALQLLLDRLCVGLNLLVLGRHQCVEVSDGRLLGPGNLGEVLLHRLLHLLEDADNLATLGCVARLLALREKGRHQVPVHRAHLHADRDPPQRRCPGGLQETARGTLLNGIDGLRQRIDVRLGIRRFLAESAGFLLAESGGLGDGLLGVRAVRLMLCELSTQLSLLLLCLLQSAVHLRDLRFGRADGCIEVLGASLAVALVLLEQLLLQLALSSDLLLHAFEHCDDTADRVRADACTLAGVEGLSAL
mmetsp:Transcript_79086/g.177149  ORF Transcript_79086/g.177149 Transcript_79086/m.177149 type:complete len:366 (+) Transcript_79086:1151-2248(+)